MFQLFWKIIVSGCGKPEGCLRANTPGAESLKVGSCTFGTVCCEFLINLPVDKQQHLTSISRGRKRVD